MPNPRRIAQCRGAPCTPLATRPPPRGLPWSQAEAHTRVSPSRVSCRLLAQIHDELLFEVEDSQVPEFAGEPPGARVAPVSGIVKASLGGLTGPFPAPCRGHRQNAQAGLGALERPRGLHPGQQPPENAKCPAGGPGRWGQHWDPLCGSRAAGQWQGQPRPAVGPEPGLQLSPQGGPGLLPWQPLLQPWGPFRLP